MIQKEEHIKKRIDARKETYKEHPEIIENSKKKVKRTLKRKYKNGLRKMCSICGIEIKGITEGQLNYNFKLHEESHGRERYNIE